MECIMSKILLSQDKQEDLNKFMPENSVVEKLANFFSSFSDGTRIKIISALCLNEMCVNDISQLLNINQTTVSHQLKFLKQYGAVTSRRDGKVIYYNISCNDINEVMLNGVNYLLEYGA